VSKKGIPLQLLNQSLGRGGGKRKKQNRDPVFDDGNGSGSIKVGFGDHECLKCSEF